MKTIFFSILLFSATVNGQDSIIKILNGLFEREIAGSENSIIDHWDTPGFYNESPADLHSSGLNKWNVDNDAYDGSKYVGLVVREHETWESIGQNLSKPLLKDHSYSFSFFACKRGNYWSRTYFSDKIQEFTTPVVIRVFGAIEKPDNTKHTEHQLLFTTVPIDNENWEEYRISFSCDFDIEYLIIEAFYNLPVIKPYNGHVFLDMVSDIQLIE